MISRVKAWWGRLSPGVRAQTARFVRLTAFAIAPQLAALVIHGGLTAAAVAAVVTGGLETAWRQMFPNSPI